MRPKKSNRKKSMIKGVKRKKYFMKVGGGNTVSIVLVNVRRKNNKLTSVHQF